jgi:hypothetical protein
MMFLSACGEALAGKTFVWINVPLDGLSFLDMQPIKYRGSFHKCEWCWPY